MRRGVLTIVLGLLLAAPAQGAAKRCLEPEPGPKGWATATPAEVGMDAEKLREALSYGTGQSSYAVRVYRYGCLVAEDVLAPANKEARFESWSLAKSITAMVFGRAMTLGLIAPEDKLGALIPEADADHGAIGMRDLLTMTSGLEWNGFRDYNIAMPDRIHDALLTPVVRPPGTYWEYSQSGPALVAEATQRAVGEDFQAFAQRELFGPIGILPGSWSWTRDSAGHTQGFFGVQMAPDDYAKLGELMRRSGLWNGRRLLSKRFVREATTPDPSSGCYGYLIWVNAGQPCVGVRIANRPVRDYRMFPRLPADLYQFSGLFGQFVTVIPSQGIIVQRSGNDAANEPGWEEELHHRVLEAIVDQPHTPPGDAPATATPDRSDPDRGFQTSFEPSALTPVTGGELPPAGPARARAVRLRAKVLERVVKLRVRCPAALGTGRCDGTVRLGKRTRAFALAAGRARTLRLHVPRKGRYVAVARVADEAGGVVSRLRFRSR